MSVAGPNLFLSSWSHVVDATTVRSSMVAAGDLESTRLVYAMVIGLAAIGVLFVVLGIWVIRQTRVDLEMLAPLERMGDRDWRKSDPASQRRSLDEIRPEGAEPIQPEPHRPRVDAEFGQSDRPVESFDDLAAIGPEGDDLASIVPEGDDQTPTGTEADDQTPTGTEAPTDSDDVELVKSVSEPDTSGDDEITHAVAESEPADVAVESEPAVESESAAESPLEQSDMGAGGDLSDGVSNEGTTERVEQ